ncbi:MAG: TadE/TadG family protein [Planctomycetales bacterium]|nr:TadE/TadG family protein [Planctomycetales bacterium]
MRTFLGQERNARRSAKSRRGAIVVLTAFLLIFLMALMALSIDVGYMQNARVEMDRAVDAGALAGAGMLVEGVDEAQAEAREFVQRNNVAGRPLNDDELEIEVGQWDRTNESFSSSNNVPFAIHVRAARNDVRPMFFGRVFGRDSFAVASEAIAMYQPRDIVVVLDYSASMNDDSEFRQMGALGQEYIESNLQLIYEELGSPAYGSLEFTPQWLTVTGNAPSNSARPQLTVEYRYDEVYITSTKPFHQVRTYRSSSSYVTSNAAGTYNSDTGLYEQTLTYNGSSQVKKVYIKSGYNTTSSTSSSNQYSEWFYFDSNSTIDDHAERCFGLNSTAYPYPGGSWSSFVSYCRSNSNNANAGYKYKYGYMNLINYWLESTPMYNQNPDLWKVSEQPITAVKNAVTLFLAYMQSLDTDDRIALAVFNSSSGDALIERELEQEFDEIDTISRHRQAGHYHGNTNLGAGLRVAWEELDDNAREGAFKMVVLMTDGQPNMPGYNPSGYVMDQVEACQDRKYPVITISLGSGADTTIMQTIADNTGGIHFNIPGGGTVAEYEDQLRSTFRQIADKRPLQLVK